MDSRCIKILVADDHECNRSLLALLLDRAGYQVDLAVDGCEAFDRMVKGVFDAVITDWEMPRLTGSQFLALSRMFWPDIPVIVVSAHAAPCPGEIPPGAYAWITKPYELHELLQVVHAAVQTSALRVRERSVSTRASP